MPRYTTDEQQRATFRDWLRGELRRLDFYQRRDDRYLVAAFARYAASRGVHLDEVSLARYLRDRDPVLPTPERCRDLARTLERPAIEVLLAAGYVLGSDFVVAPPVAPAAPAASPAHAPRRPASWEREVARIEREIAGYGQLPRAVRDAITASLTASLRGGGRGGDS